MIIKIIEIIRIAGASFGIYWAYYVGMESSTPAESVLNILTPWIIVSIAGTSAIEGLFFGKQAAAAHGFKDAEDYYEKSSSKQYIPAIKTPTLLVTSLDDPFFSSECYPFREANQNPHFFLEATKYGGHVGFASSFNVAKNNWCENRILSFLTYKE